jgi:hypothetical protein
VTHFLTALCCAHNDISLYFACSLTSARQVAVACFTAALSGWFSALANVGARRSPHAMTVATVLCINELPQLQSAPVTVLARLRDNHATQRREMTKKRLLGPSPRRGGLSQEEILQHEFPLPPSKRTTAGSARYLSIIRLRSSLSFDRLIESTAVRACEWIECRWPATRHDTHPIPNS